MTKSEHLLLKTHFFVSKKISAYILNDNNQPFIIYGEAGSGKTSLIAKVADKVINMFENSNDYVVIMRYFGTTSSTSNIISTYKSILHQLECILKLELTDTYFPSIYELKDYLYEKILLFKTTYPDKKLVILLDSIDQLSEKDYDLYWIFYELPKNVKIVLTTLKDFENILETIKLSVKNAENYLEIKPMNSEDAKKMLNDLLNNSNRSLSEQQWNVLEEIFKESKLHPLLVKLVYDIVSKWSSYYIPNQEFRNIREIDDCIIYLFKLLEKEHGEVLFARCMFYMNIMRNGISEIELEDIMSIDDNLLMNIFEYHSPPIRRFPIVLWTRIKFNLSEYIVEREIDDTKVDFWLVNT